MEPPDHGQLEKKSQFSTISLKKVPADWNVRYETPAGKAWTRGPPQANAEEAPRTAAAESECLGNRYTYPLSEIRSFPPTACRALLGISACGARLASYSAGVPQISSIL